jgi:hypothetical protein
MRIQEMRSGRAYLRKRTAPERRHIFETRDLSEVFPRDDSETAPMPEAPSVSSELDKPLWSVVSFSEIEAGGLTYSQATRLVEALASNGIPGLCIVTDVAAGRI